jgi:aryl-alcohol dehydrogenase-like predicted oxidoreductase
MKFRKLGKNGPLVSEIGLGCGGRFAGPETSEEQVGRALDRAIDLGINFLDTGSNYGGGLSERRLGRLLQGRRAKVILATKCGSRMMFEEGKPPYTKRDFTYDGLIRSTEDSLKRLSADHVDLLQFHSAPAQALVPGCESLAALLEMKKRGWTRFLGTSCDPARALQAIALGIFDCVQVSYNVVMQEVEAQVLPAALAAGVGVIVKEPIANAFFLGKPKPKEEDSWQWPCWEQSARYAFLKECTSPTPVQTALQFVLASPAVTTAIAASVEPRHIEENVAVSGMPPIDPAIQARIRTTFRERA